MAKKNGTANGVLKNKDLLRFRNGLKAVGDYRGIKFAYAVVKTLRLVETELADLQKSNTWGDEYKEYDKQRQELVMKYAKKDKEGKAITFQDGAALKTYIEDEDVFNAMLKKLRAKYAKAVKEQEAKDVEFEKFLEKPAAVKVHTVPEDLIPKDISAKHLQGIFEIVE